VNRHKTRRPKRPSKRETSQISASRTPRRAHLQRESHKTEPPRRPPTRETSQNRPFQTPPDGPLQRDRHKIGRPRCRQTRETSQIPPIQLAATSPATPTTSQTSPASFPPLPSNNTVTNQHVPPSTLHRIALPAPPLPPPACHAACLGTRRARPPAREHTRSATAHGPARRAPSARLPPPGRSRPCATAPPAATAPARYRHARPVPPRARLRPHAACQASLALAPPARTRPCAAAPAHRHRAGPLPPRTA